MNRKEALGWLTHLFHATDLYVWVLHSHGWCQPCIGDEICHDEDTLPSILFNGLLVFRTKTPSLVWSTRPCWSVLPHLTSCYSSQFLDSLLLQASVQAVHSYRTFPFFSPSLPGNSRWNNPHGKHAIQISWLHLNYELISQHPTLLCYTYSTCNEFIVGKSFTNRFTTCSLWDLRFSVTA